MKNYLSKSNQSICFITDYKRKDDMLEIHYGRGVPDLIPYTREEEEKLLKRMREQVLNAGEFEKVIRKKYALAYKTFWFGFIIAGISLLAGTAAANGMDDTVIELMYLPGFIGPLIGLIEIVKFLDFSDSLEDLEKNKLFLENEEKLNEKIREKKNTLREPFECAKEIAEESIVDDFALTLNAIDEMDYDELREMIDYYGLKKATSNIQNEKEQENIFSMAEEKPKEFIKK